MRRAFGWRTMFLAAAALCGAAVATLPARGSAQGPLRRAPDGRPLALTFSDDFRTLRLWNGKSGVWRTRFGDASGPDAVGKRTLASNGELQVYVDPGFRGLGLSPFAVQGGGLDIVARPVPAPVASKLDGYRYASGLITTQPSFAQRYGYFEVRARLPAGKGLWPAIWLLPADMSWPPEIDVLESIGDPSRGWCTVHSTRQPTHGTEFHIASPGQFHTFAVSWDPKSVICYVDGRETGRQPTPADLSKPMFLLINLAVGGGWPGSPDPSTPFPAKLSIAWVRAYRFA